jgi:ribosomal protein S18 acetylase RimI-like enzyme
MIVREAEKDDARGCIDLCRSDGVSYWRSSDFEGSSESDNAIFFVAEEGSEIIGYVLGFILPTKRTEALLHETRIKKQERGKEIGTKLVNAFCEEAFGKGAEVVLAEIEPNLLGFYAESCGFEERGQWIEVGRQRD